MKKFLFLKAFLTNAALLILLLFLSNCQDKDDFLQENDHTAPAIYKEKIGDYWNLLKIGSDVGQLSKIEELSIAIDTNSIKIYDLRTTEKLLIADAKSLKGLEGTTKIIFYLNEDTVVRSNIVTLKNSQANSNINNVILSVLNADKNDFNYSGEITFLSLSKTKLIYNKYDKGEIIENGTLSGTTDSRKSSKTQESCIEYWWITRYGGEIISRVYLFSICNCSGGGSGGVGEELSKMNNCGGTSIFLGGSGASSTTTYKPNLPLTPVDNQTYRHTDPDGVCTEYIFKISTNSWQILQVILPNIVIPNNRDNYGILEYQWPVNNQKVFDRTTNLLYTYEQGSDSWIGVPATDQLVAEAIEEKIDDSQLDPCTKAILAKLKNLTQNDIASIFEKFGVPANGTYNLKIVKGKPNDPAAIADTKRISKNNYLITISESYLKGTDNNQRPPTDLSIASKIIHEIIHAHFFALYDDFHNNGDICAYDNYDCLFMEFVSKNFEGTTDPQHAQMFENYIDIMASVLQEFQTGVPVSNTGKAELFYHDLALSTLGGTQFFKERYPLDYNAPTYPERKRITYVSEAEEDNKIIDDEENGKYLPKGKPCIN